MTPAEITYARRVMADATGNARGWRPAPGSIVFVGEERQTTVGGADDVAYYGGHLIGESMAHRDALAACVALEMLPKAMAEIERLRGAGRLQLAR